MDVLLFIQRVFSYMVGEIRKHPVASKALAVLGSAFPVVALAGGVAGATTTTVLATATTAAKTTVLKYIGVALLGVIAVFGLMIGIKLLFRLYHKVTGR